MVVTSIRQAGSLKPQVKVRELRLGQAEIPLIKRAMELASRPSIYKRSEPLMSHRDSGDAARDLASRPKNHRTLYKLPLHHLPAPPAPPISGFSPLSKKFLKNFSPRVPARVRRALNRRAAPSCRPKTPEFRGKTAHARLAAAPIFPVKHCPRTLKNPPLTHLREKKLSKVRSTPLTRPLRGCILEYMRLKEPRRPPHTGGTRSTDRLRKFQTNPPRVRRSGALITRSE